MILRRWTLLLGLALAPLMVAARPAVVHAQCNAELEMDRAAEMIDRARDRVDRSALREARELLDAARRRLGEARGQHGHGNQARACQYARVAQTLAAKAVEVARRGDRAVTGLENLMARTDDLLREAASSVEAGASPRGRRLLRAAGNQQAQARRAFDAGRLRLALKLTTLARTTADRAVRLTLGRPSLDAGGIGKALGDTDRLLEEAARVLDAGEGGGGKPGETLLARARRMQDAARRQAAEGRGDLSLLFTRQARLLATEALGRVDVALDPAEVAGVVDDAAELVGSLLDGAPPDAGRGARDLLARASRLIQDARAGLAQGDLPGALVSARAAAALALDVAERLGPPGRD